MSEGARSRRAVLASGATFLASGCSSLGRSSDDSDVFCEYEAEAEPVDPAKRLRPEYSPAQRALAARAVRQGSATAFYGPRPLKTDSYVVVDGAFYDVFQSGSYTVELPALKTSVEWESGRRAPESASHRSFADLPRVDRRALRSVVYGGIYRTHVHPETRLVHSESPVPYPDGVADSELPTDDPLWVRWDDRDYRVTVHRVTTVRRRVYEYAASKVAPNAEAFRRRIADRYLVRLDDLTPEQRTILDEAIGEGYHRETRSCFSTFHRLEDRLPERTLPESDTPYYVEYEGTRYGLSVSWVCQGTWSCGR